jgi:hypothetical protein
MEQPARSTDPAGDEVTNYDFFKKES